ncbi:glycoside hydrolase family 43 protein [Acidaminobacter sp. JC074]|uniref:glycoside hydrolase family 43 protein n=1 Tax=Acidaminobacter sp. JC074 TaxID=2530199 RepID=UPI001F0D7003|nr:glycoside hydrolase family 43 protein [Acidaminobacter sp. JC074]MCH4889546.1 glycoside hydrolase family 43 protein [Acidaminobacter sp. JC074]
MKNKETYTNPIIPGFYPDPSICRVGEDYYLVNSSFEYFPAIPVWHSKDLVNWTQICNAIDREEQNLKLHDVAPSGGVQACTIRHHNGIFYITSTCVGKEWPRPDYNFLITATNPAGPWSEVKYLKDAPGIDSSLFFDDDGRAYFLANREKEDAVFIGDTEIWIQEFDLDTLDLKGPRYGLWDGCGGIHPEGPHIYKRNGYYYLLIAEGGTGYDHAVTLAKSNHVLGPYESAIRNPILTHRHLGFEFPIQSTGHADLVETQNGDWYMVCLATRPKAIENENKAEFANLGRETFLIPVEWQDDDSPIVSPMTGKIEEVYPFPKLERVEALETTQNMLLNTIRQEEQAFYCKKDAGYRLSMQEAKLFEDLPVSFLGRRQTEWQFSADTEFTFNLNEGESAGIALFYSYMANISFSIYNEKGKQKLILEKAYKGAVSIISEIFVSGSDFKLRVDGNNFLYKFYISIDEKDYEEVASVEDGWFLSSGAAGGHTGTYVGMYVSSNGKTSKNFVDFKRFNYCGH